jgi:hypothetical protein
MQARFRIVYSPPLLEFSFRSTYDLQHCSVLILCLVGWAYASILLLLRSISVHQQNPIFLQNTLTVLYMFNKSLFCLSSSQVRQGNPSTPR